MSKHRLEIVAGDLPRGTRRKQTSLEDAILKRWRKDAQTAHEAAPDADRDVIPLLDGWLRRLERQSSSPTDERR
jgi:hypothetical protein